jgi:hypothetical protein
MSNLTRRGSHCPNRLNSRVEWYVLNSFAVNYVQNVYEVDLLHDRQATLKCDISTEPMYQETPNTEHAT